LGASTGLVQAYGVTVFATVIGTLLNMAVNVLVSVGLSNKQLPYRSALTMFMVVTMYFGPGMIPAYMMNKYLGLINNIWVYVWPGLMSVWNMFLMRNFIMGIPHEIIESAHIDGCSEPRMIVSIILPLSTACIATISLFYAVGHWNDLFSAVMYVTDPKKYSLQAYLMTILQDARNMRYNLEEMAKIYEAGNKPPPSEALKAANIMAATIPIVCVYPFLQKYFVKGVVVGSLKG
jgi:putative aldouronate transport system permease protein